MKKQLKITLKTFYGLEQPLADELAELGYKDSRIANRAVQIKGTWEDVYRLNYRCRLALSVLVEVSTFFIQKEDDLYREAKKIDWPSYFDVTKTFAVKGAVFSTLFRHSQYPLLVVKDAIVDVFREKKEHRPNVNIKAPQVMFDLYVREKKVVISLNTSGIPLFQRGYRQKTGEAPINEVLAAGMLRLSGWDRKSCLIDPMCGSGTIAIEAALWAADIPPQIERSHFAFKNFNSYNDEVWNKVQKEGNHRPIDLGFEIIASDNDGQMIQIAKRNSKVAPIGRMISFIRQDALQLHPPSKKGTLLCNPPYEERMGENVEELYLQLGDTFKHNFIGFNCWVISSNFDALKNIGLKPNSKIKLYNGELECSFREYQIFEGTNKEHIQQEKAKPESKPKKKEENQETPKPTHKKKSLTKETSNERKKSSKYATSSTLVSKINQLKKNR